MPCCTTCLFFEQHIRASHTIIEMILRIFRYFAFSLVCTLEVISFGFDVHNLLTVNPFTALPACSRTLNNIVYLWGWLDSNQRLSSCKDDSLYHWRTPPYFCWSVEIRTLTRRTKIFCATVTPHFNMQVLNLCAPASRYYVFS